MARTLIALAIAAALSGLSCSGQSGSDRSCVVTPGTVTQLTDRIALAQCGDGSICIGACGGQQDSGNTTDSNNPDNSDNSDNSVNDSNNRINPTPTPGRG